jgi:hypothetical protein
LVKDGHLATLSVPDHRVVAKGTRGRGGIMALSRAARTIQRRRFLEREIWADIPDELLDKPHDDALDDEILGYGPDGVRSSTPRPWWCRTRPRHPRCAR